jgi:hypothetical protein
MDNTFSLIINFIGFKQLRLELLNGAQKVEAVDFSFDSNLDTLLIENIDKVLKRNRITTSSLEEVKITGDVDPNSSAYKIAQTWLEAVKTFKKPR